MQNKSIKRITSNPKLAIMKSVQPCEGILQKENVNFAMKNYQIYLNHYKSRNMAPMSFEDFLKNYN